MMLEGSIVTVVAIAWLFLRMAQEGEVRQELIEQGHDPRLVRRAVRYRRWASSTRRRPDARHRNPPPRPRRLVDRAQPPFLPGAPEPLGYDRVGEVIGERGETIHYVAGGGVAIGIRRRSSAESTTATASACTTSPSRSPRATSSTSGIAGSSSSPSPSRARRRSTSTPPATTRSSSTTRTGSARDRPRARPRRLLELRGAGLARLAERFRDRGELGERGLQVLDDLVRDHSGRRRLSRSSSDSSRSHVRSSETLSRCSSSSYVKRLKRSDSSRRCRSPRAGGPGRTRRQESGRARRRSARRSPPRAQPRRERIE